MKEPKVSLFHIFVAPLKCLSHNHGIIFELKSNFHEHSKNLIENSAMSIYKYNIRCTLLMCSLTFGRDLLDTHLLKHIWRHNYWIILRNTLFFTAYTCSCQPMIWKATKGNELYLVAQKKLGRNKITNVHYIRPVTQQTYASEHKYRSHTGAGVRDGKGYKSYLAYTCKRDTCKPARTYQLQSV